MKKICLVSILASHYRESIYRLLETEFNCDFFFGEHDSSVKRLDKNVLQHTLYLKNRYLFRTNCFVQTNIVGLTSKYNIIINDLGIYCLSAWMILFISKIKKQQIYNWDHGWYGREGFIKKWLKRLYNALASGTFVYGNYARNLMIKNGFNPNKLYVIHNSLNYDKQIELRNLLHKTDIYEKHFCNSYPTLCFVGRLTKVKRLELLVQALLIIKKQGYSINCVIIGDGEQKNNLQSMVNLYGLNKQIWFYGPSYAEQTNAELLYNADLCVAPGNIGLTAIHAMMFGCPCMSHDDFPWQMPEFEAIHEGITGAYFKRENVESLADAIIQWFNVNGNRREEIRQACYEEIDSQWNPHRQLNVFRQVLLKL